MDNNILKRLGELISTGQGFVNGIGRSSHGTDFWISDRDTVLAQAWISSTAFLIKNLAPVKSHYLGELESILDDKNYKNGSNIPYHTVQKLLGVLVAVNVEYNNGSLKEYEYIHFASVFDDFLDHAEHFHKGGKLQEGAVLSSIVLEDTIKKICKKNDVPAAGVEESIDNLAAAGVFTPVKAKAFKGICGVRQKALHADWEGFDLVDLGKQIKGVKELIADYL